MIRVMVVDDEPPIQRIICRKIEDADAEFQVTATAYNGEEALELLEKGGAYAQLYNSQFA